MLTPPRVGCLVIRNPTLESLRCNWLAGEVESVARETISLSYTNEKCQLNIFDPTGSVPLQNLMKIVSNTYVQIP